MTSGVVRTHTRFSPSRRRRIGVRTTGGVSSFTSHVRRIVLVSLFVVAAAAQAAAQPQTQAPRGLTFEEIDNGWVVSPDFRVTEVDGEVSHVAGIYGGWLMDHRLLIGIGAYWLVDGPNDTDLKYFGPVVGWSTNFGGRFDVSLRGLVGLGTATRRFDADGAGGDDGFRCSRFTCHGRSFPAFARYRDELFVAEPHISLFTHVTDWLGVNLGVGYRFTGRELGIDSSLEGASMSVGFRIGPS